MSFDYSKLCGKIKEVCRTQDEFARRMGLGRVSISMRLNNKLDFSNREIRNACDILGIPKDEIPSYFFCLNSSEN